MTNIPLLCVKRVKTKKIPSVTDKKIFDTLFASYSSLQQHELFCKTLCRACKKHYYTQSCKLYQCHTSKPIPLRL